MDTFFQHQWPCSPSCHGRASGSAYLGLIIGVASSACLLMLLSGIHLQWLAAYRHLMAQAQLEDARRQLIALFQPAIANSGYLACATGLVAPVMIVKPPLPSMRHVSAYAGKENGWYPALPATLNKVLPGTDVLELMQALPCGGRLADLAAGSDPGIALSCPHRCDFAPSDIILITQCLDAHVLRINNLKVCDGSSSVVDFSLEGNSSHKLCRHYDAYGECVVGQVVDYPAFSQVLGLQSTLWFLRKGRDGSPSLWRLDTHRPAGGNNPAEWMVGVEKFSLRFALKEQPFSSTWPGLAADQIVDWGSVSAIALTLGLVSSEGGLLLSQKGVGEDGHLHLVFTLRSRFHNVFP